MCALLTFGVVGALAWQGASSDSRRRAESVEKRESSLSLVAAVLGDSSCHTASDTTAAVVVYALLILYTFLGLAIVCDEYFCESLEQISAALHLSDDVAGATFMAAGSSAPELFTALITVFIEPGEQGVGTIVGSAVFNICVIIGLTSLGAGQVLQLWWYPLTRDSAVYAVSILLMVWAMYDQQVTVFEAGCLVGVYAVYVLLMVLNGRIVACLHALRRKQAEAALELRLDPMIYISGVNPAHRPAFRASACKRTAVRRTDARAQMASMIRVAQTVDAAKDQFLKLVARRRSQHEQVLYDATDAAAEEEDAGCMGRLLGLLAAPLTCAMASTIPDCREQSRRSLYFATFTMSIVWIGVLSFLMVDFADRAGCILGVPEFLMGLVVLSVGTSVPDALSSMIVARNGQGNMAVCNVLGSNVFNILLGLGLPWLIAAYMQGAPFQTGQTSITEPALILFGYLVGLLAILLCSRWRLTPTVGWLLLLLQAAYWAWNICAEYGLVSFANLSRLLSSLRSQLLGSLVGKLCEAAGLRGGACAQ